MASARGKDCTVRIPSVCNRDAETTVGAHVNDLKFRQGHKAPNYLVARCCSSCHAVVDAERDTADFSYQTIKQMHYEGVLLSLMDYVEEGLMEIHD